jgi:DNA-binding LytR/AlgR family response regulator
MSTNSNAAFAGHPTTAPAPGQLDYLLTPYALERLTLAVQRLRQRIGTDAAPLDQLLHELTSLASARKPLRWINASHGGDVKLIRIDEVQYFQADTKYTRVVTPDGEALIHTPLKELQERLDPADFWAIHRSTIVNVNRVAGVTRDFRGRVFVRLKSRSETLPVSDAHVHLFRQM